MTQAETEQAWGKDRATLIDCGNRLGAVVGYYGGLADELRGGQ